MLQLPGMAALILEGEGHRRVELDRPALSLGSSEACDLVLVGRGVQPQHAVVFQEGAGFRIAASAGARLSVNGKRVNSAALSDGDRLALGTVVLTLSGSTAAERPRPSAASTAEGALTALGSFAATLAGGHSWGQLLEGLLGATVRELAADAGMLTAPGLHQGEARVFLCHPPVADPEGVLRSDTLIAEVLATGAPQLHPDPDAPGRWKAATSLAGGDIASAAAVALRLPGETFGVLYVSRRGGRSPFERGDLTALSAFAGVASLLLGNARELTELGERIEGLTTRLRALEGEDLVGDSPAILALKGTAERIAASGLSVLIQGETGTGKELVARLLHHRSGRKGPFVAQSCAAIPAELAESLLFGSVRGAFTGAEDRPGLFEAAGGGTLFLDEVGELPPALQPKLLRVLQERTVVRVGDSRDRPVDVRVLAATHRDLAPPAFRQDLYFRLAQMVLRVPALRERGDDVILLAHHFLRQARPGLAFTPRARECLSSHRWPGNVRELQGRVRTAALLARRREITPHDLGFGDEEAIEPLEAARDRFVRRHVEEAVALAGGNKKRAAELLGIGLRSLFRYLEEAEP